MEGILTSGQAAAMLSIPERSLLEYCRQGRIPFKRIGRHYRFSAEVLRQWIEAPAEAPRAVVKGNRCTRHAGRTDKKDNPFYLKDALM